jgi:hypothetical protein
MAAKTKFKKNPAAVALGRLGGLKGGKGVMTGDYSEFYLTTVQNQVHF